MPKFNKLIVVFHKIESPVYVFRYLLHDWESFEAITEINTKKRKRIIH